MLTVSVPSKDATKVVYSKGVKFDAGAIMYTSEVVEKDDYYRVYAMGRLCLLTKNPGEAIGIADGVAGVVVDMDGNIIWNRYKSNYAKVNISDEDNLTKYLQIIGATLDEALYYIDKGMVLSVKTPSGYKKITAYDSTNVTIIDEEGNTTVSTKNDFARKADSMGNVIIVYKVNR